MATTTFAGLIATNLIPNISMDVLLLSLLLGLMVRIILSVDD